MTLLGKGFFLLNLSQCEEGDPVAIVAATQAAGLSHLIVKIADGEKALGIDASGIDFAAPVVQALHTAGIAVWGWQNVFGDDPMAEAAVAIARTQALGLDGYVVEPKSEYQRPGMARAARQFMNAIRAALTIPIALRSYRFPNYHPELPWSTFLEFCDMHMPKVTWESALNAGDQLRESKRQCDSLPNSKPYIPTGAAYPASGWSPTVEEIHDFMNTAKALGLPAINFFNWDACRLKLPLLWAAIAGFSWPVQETFRAQATASISSADTFLSKFMTALNSHQAAQLSALYDSTAIQVWADQVRSGTADIQTGYSALFENLPPETIFTLSQAQEDEDKFQFSWKAGSLSGETKLVIKNGKITLDYTFIS